MKSAVRQLLFGSGGPSLRNYNAGNPLYLAHRGNAFLAPEETMEAYMEGLNWRVHAMEQDVQATSDGVLVLMHDTTIDRTTTGTGSTALQPSSSWTALVIDAEAQNVWGYGNALHPPFFRDVITALNRKCILVPEVKVTGVKQSVVDALLSAGVRRDQALVQSFTIADLAPAVAAGYPAIFLTTTTTDIAAARSAGIGWVGVDETAGDAVVSAWVAAGFKVMAYTVDRRYRRDELQALGVVGYFSNDTVYLSGGYRATSDNFAAGKWMPGMVGGLTVAANRGQMLSGTDKWQMPLNAGNFNSVLQGWACPIKGNANADTFTVDVKITFNTANLADATRWAGVFFNSNDKAFLDGVAPTVGEQGFHFLMRKNGQMQIFKRSTTASTAVATTSTLAIADGEEVAYRIVTTPTALSLHRLDGSGNITFTATIADSDAAFRGGYMHIGRAGLSVDFRDITIS